MCRNSNRTVERAGVRIEDSSSEDESSLYSKATSSKPETNGDASGSYSRQSSSGNGKQPTSVKLIYG